MNRPARPSVEGKSVTGNIATGLAAVVLLGLTMFARWIPVYREPSPPVEVLRAVNETLAVPAEGNFPVAVIAAHGLLAGSTLVLVSSRLLVWAGADVARADHTPR